MLDTANQEKRPGVGAGFTAVVPSSCRSLRPNLRTAREKNQDRLDL